MTEIFTKKELNAKAELALMGVVTPVRDKDNIIYMLDYIAGVLDCKEQTGEEVFKKATQYTNLEETYIVGMSCSTILGDMRCVNLIFKDKEDTKFKLDSEDGVLCYVYNYTAPDCSELGYSFFKKHGTMYRRYA